jgi:signal transduction histidine kinase
MVRFLLLFIFTCFSGFASPIMLKDAAPGINIVPYSSYLIDSDDSIGVDELLSHAEEFQDAAGDNYSFGFVNKPLWIRFALEDEGMKKEEWILNIQNPQIDNFRLYRQENGRLVKQDECGDTVSECHSDYHCRTFWIPVEAGRTYYLYVRTKGSLQVPLRLEKLMQAHKTEEVSLLLYGIYYGILLILILYNLVIYAVVREIHYINYLFFLGSYMLWQLSFDGIGAEWLWPGVAWMANDALSFFIFLSSLMAFRFARNFLQLDRFEPLLYRIFVNMERVSLAGIVMVLLVDYHISVVLATLWVAVTPVIMIYAGYRVLPLYRPARFYLIGWLFFLLATILIALNKLGLIPSHQSIVHLQQIGSLLEMTFLSFALADRISMMKREHMSELRRLNQSLKEKIDKKVEEVRAKDKMMMAQSRQAAMGEMIENIAHQWRQPLNQLSLIQQNIFIDHTLGNFDEKKMEHYQQQSEKLLGYMTTTIDDFRRFFQPDREVKPFSACRAIKKTVELLESMLQNYNIGILSRCDSEAILKGHANEFSQVVMNLMQNAKDALVERGIEAPKITIDVRLTHTDVLIEVCDNAGGVDAAIKEKIFDPYFTTKFQTQGTGIGLYMSKMIIEKSMGGTLAIENRDDGACFMIALPKQQG